MVPTQTGKCYTQTPQQHMEQQPSPQRKLKTLIVGPKTGITASLAKLAHAALIVLRFLPKLSLTVVLADLLALILLKRRAIQLNTWYKKLLFAYFASESAFYLFMQVRQEFMLQRKERERVPELTSVQRQILFDRCLQVIPPKEFLENWFEPKLALKDLKRENVEELLAWAFFHRNNIQMEMSVEERNELERMVSKLELQLDNKFPSGRNCEAKILKFTEDRVEGKHRSWLIYAVVHGLFQLVFVPAHMHWHGYINCRSGDLTYWYRAGRKGCNKPPVVFLHGIGVGILPYQQWIAMLEKLADMPDGSNSLAGRAIIVPEIQVISQRLFPDELHVKTFAFDLNHAIVHQQGHDRACFVGHSYGTFCTAWMVKFYPQTVAAVGLIDPVSKLLHSVDVLHNIVYHKPLNNSVEYVLNYIMCSEVSLVHNLKRQFYWFQNILFLEEIDTIRVPTFVCLADTDQLVPIHEIKDYVQRYNNGELIQVENAPAKPNGQVDFLWFNRCDHAGFIFNKGYMQQTADAVERICKKQDEV